MVKVELEIEGREQVRLEVEVDGGGLIQKASLWGLGDWAFLKLLQEARGTLKGPLKDVPLPSGSSPGALLMREALLRAQGQWNPPYQEEELCHCRAVSTKKVEDAILAGAHSPREVSLQTSASTACGTCRPNVEAMIQYRLHPSKTA